MPTGGVEATKESITAWFKAGCRLRGHRLAPDQQGNAGRRGLGRHRQAGGQVVGWVQKARGKPLFGAIEHVGVYPGGEAGTSAEIAEWYRKMFGWPVTPAGSTGFFANQGKYGWIEAMAKPAGERTHIAVIVSDFDAACADLKARGYELGETRGDSTYSLVYLKDRDPGGNLVHIVCRY